MWSIFLLIFGAVFIKWVYFFWDNFGCELKVFFAEVDMFCYAKLWKSDENNTLFAAAFFFYYAIYLFKSLISLSSF